MREDVATRVKSDARKDFSVWYYTSATWSELIRGETFSGRRIDLTPFVRSGEFSSSEASVNLAWEYEFNSDGVEPAFPAWQNGVSYAREVERAYNKVIYRSRTDDSEGVPPTGDPESSAKWAEIRAVGLPKVGGLVEVFDEVAGVVRFRGYIDAIKSRGAYRGERRSSLSVRSRDASSYWRNTRWVTDIYPTGTDLGVLIEDVLDSHGLDPWERPWVGPTGFYTPHSGTQFADVPSWEMLTVVYQAMRQAPWIDALGRFKAISRDVTRPADVTLTEDDVDSIDISGSSQAPTSVVLKWLDRLLSESVQQPQSLATDRKSTRLNSSHT